MGVLRGQRHRPVHAGELRSSPEGSASVLSRDAALSLGVRRDQVTHVLSRGGVRPPAGASWSRTRSPTRSRSRSSSGMYAPDRGRVRGSPSGGCARRGREAPSCFPHSLALGGSRGPVIALVAAVVAMSMAGRRSWKAHFRPGRAPARGDPVRGHASAPARSKDRYLMTTEDVSIGGRLDAAGGGMLAVSRWLSIRSARGRARRERATSPTRTTWSSRY